MQFMGLMLMLSFSYLISFFRVIYKNTRLMNINKNDVNESTSWHLHHGWRPTIIHRDVKSAKILLRESLDAKIADFGLSKGLRDDQATHISTNINGMTCVLDPEINLFLRALEAEEKLALQRGFTQQCLLEMKPVCFPSTVELKM